MKHAKSLIVGVLVIAGLGVGLVSAGVLDFNSRKSVEFFSGHTHDAEGTHGAPSHSGRTDKYGCHNKSVPYHCH